MELPIELKLEIEKRLEKENVKKLQEKAEEISLKYRNESGKGQRLVTDNVQVLSYAAVRMPATYGAVSTVMDKIIELMPEFSPKSLLDVGAGTGTATWAISKKFNLENIICLEREAEMRKLGKSLMQVSEEPVVQKANWKEFELTKQEISEKADIVVASYVLNEMDKEEYLNVIEKLWNSTNQILIIIEPGTPVGFSEIRTIREKLIKKGGQIVAPCTHSQKCQIAKDDWCHTTCRVARTKIHKNLKSGNVPYEDEKFSYIVFSKHEISKTENARILRHPKIEPGKVTLDLCNSDGTVSKQSITKKDKDMFKNARKANCGDLFKYPKIEYRDLYDEEKNTTGKIFEKGSKIPKGYYMLTVIAIMENQDGKYLIQKSSEAKGADWASTGGHPKAGENSYQGILQEIKEELGLDVSNQKLELFETVKTEDDFVDLYYVKMNIDLSKIKMQLEEVQEVKLVTEQELKEMINDGNFRKSHAMVFEKFWSSKSNKEIK